MTSQSQLHFHPSTLRKIHKRLDTPFHWIYSYPTLPTIAHRIPLTYRVTCAVAPRLMWGGGLIPRYLVKDVYLFRDLDMKVVVFSFLHTKTSHLYEHCRPISWRSKCYSCGTKRAALVIAGFECSTRLGGYAISAAFYVHYCGVGHRSNLARSSVFQNVSRINKLNPRLRPHLHPPFQNPKGSLHNSTTLSIASPAVPWFVSALPHMHQSRNWDTSPSSVRGL